MSTSTPTVAQIMKDSRLVDLSRVTMGQAIVKSAGTSPPSTVDLTKAITSIAPESHMKSAAQIVITILDPQMDLFRSGFFKSDDNPAKLRLIDVNFPEGSKYWWRLTDIQYAGTARTMQLTFTNRVAAEMQSAFDKLKANRATMTRAEFLKHVVSLAAPEATFFSLQLDTKQKIDPTKAGDPKASDIKESVSKKPGITGESVGLTARGQQVTPAQIKVVNQIIAVAQKVGASNTALAAAIYAGIWESNLDPNAKGTSSSGVHWGVFSTQPKYFDQHDTIGMATAFFKGGGGFASPGANTLANTGASVPEIAIKTEVASIWPDNAYARESDYPGDAKATTEAKKFVLEAGGLSPTASVEENQPYYFQIPASTTVSMKRAGEKREDDWSGSVRIAEQVNWEFFTEADAVYYDSEQTLIGQVPAARFSPDDHEVQDWDFEWEVRHIATQMTLYLICHPFRFHAGQVLALDDWGIASTGSTAHPDPKPGRWLISDITRDDLNALTSTLTLVQPDFPLREPAPPHKSVTRPRVSVTGQDEKQLPLRSIERAYAAARRLSAMQLPYCGEPRNLSDPPPSTGYDCSSSTAWVLWQAGMYNGSLAAAWATNTAGGFDAWGAPGRGAQMTVWLKPLAGSSGHVFIEFNMDNKTHVQLNTVNDGGPGTGPRIEPWSYSNADAGDGAAESGLYTPRHWPNPVNSAPPQPFKTPKQPEDAAGLLSWDDSADAAALPLGQQVGFYYVDGSTANKAAVQARLPGATLIGYTVFGGTDHDCNILDVEEGNPFDVDTGPIVTWVTTQLAAGVSPVGVYADLNHWSFLGLQEALDQFGSRIKRHLASYDGSPTLPHPYDAKQYAGNVDVGGGHKVDKNVSLPSFFGL